MKRLNTLLSIAIAAMMISGAFMVLGPTVAAKATTIADPEPLDLGYKIRDQVFDTNALSQNGNTADNAVPGDYWIVGDQARFYVGSYGKTSWMYFTMRIDGNNCEIWTANDMTFPEGDPRNEQTSRLTITDEQAQYMVDQFDNNIYPTESQYFSTPPALDGSGSIFEEVYGFPESRLFRTHDPGKVMIMVLNIADDNFYDPSYPYYIVGFFSPSTDLYYARNIIHIDVWDWANRTGGDTPDHARDYLIEGTIAHEYQHLLHNYLDPQETTWINEGCSDYAEMLCNYGVPESHIAHYLYNPSNALTEWGDQGDINILADYGAAALFMIYMNDHFGGADFISHLARNTEIGTDSVTSTLHEVGYWQWTYQNAFKAFRLANLIRSDTPGNGLYNYVSLDLNAIQDLTINAYSMSEGPVVRSEFLGPTITMEGYDTGVDTVSASSVDYYSITDFGGLAKTGLRYAFNGQDKVYANNWEVISIEGTDFWYSQTGIDLADQKLIAEFGVNDGDVFEFDTMWSIEEFWDYGFVQVSTNKGTTWESLAYEYTISEVDPSAISTVVDNVPGLTGEGGWVHVSLDLSDYAGEDILLSFRYVTDWSTTWDGWIVGNFVYNGEALPLETFTPAYENVDFCVTMYFPATDRLPARITDVPIFQVNEQGVRYLAWFSGYTEAYILVSPNNGPVDYAFGIMSPRLGSEPPLPPS